MRPRCFPPPWSVEEQDACFVVRDHTGQALASINFEDEPGRRSAAKLLSKDEARTIAVNIAKVPELVGLQRHSAGCRFWQYQSGHALSRPLGSCRRAADGTRINRQGKWRPKRMFRQRALPLPGGGLLPIREIPSIHLELQRRRDHGKVSFAPQAHLPCPHCRIEIVGGCGSSVTSEAPCRQAATN